MPKLCLDKAAFRKSRRALGVSLTNTREPAGALGLCGGGDVVRHNGYRPIPPVSN